MALLKVKQPKTTTLLAIPCTIDMLDAHYGRTNQRLSPQQKDGLCGWIMDQELVAMPLTQICPQNRYRKSLVMNH